MKFLHIADIHIGRRIGEFSLLEDQQAVLDQILDIAREEKPDGVLICGDVYDKSLPAGEAVTLLDDFLTGLVALHLPVFMVSGNHDSPERLNFGSRIMHKSGLHICGTYDGTVRKEVLEDAFGKVNIFLLPFLKPGMVRGYFDAEIQTHDDAVRAALGKADIHAGERNILVAHQFVVNGGQTPVCSDSETISVGGLGNVDAGAFDAFDYAALGHLHRPQPIGRGTVRYAGSPLKYSFSEAYHDKSVTIVELREKGCVDIRTIPLVPLRDMREIKGPIEELIRAGAEGGKLSEDYIHAVITDEDEIYDAVGQLRQVYPNLMHIDFENKRTTLNADAKTAAAGEVSRKSPLELFSEFYRSQNNEELSGEQQEIMRDIFEKAGGTGL